MKVAVVASHPVQYQAPWFRTLARFVDLDVFFCHRQDAAGQSAAGFGVDFEWDVPILEGYRHQWLTNRSSAPSVSSFSGCDTPDVGRVLVEGRFDACIVNGWYLKSYLQTIWACRRAGIPIVSRGDSQLTTERSPLWTLAKYMPYRALLHALDAHLYVGRANRDYLKHYGVTDGRLFFAPHFVDTAFFAREATRARENGEARALREALGIPLNAMVFMFAGKLIEKKHPADFVRALSVLQRDRSTDAPLCGLVVGSGPLEADLQELAKSQGAEIRFAGFQNQSQLPRHYAAADALVLPSDARETWGLVVNESMACGLPAVVSDACGCARDLVDDGLTGAVFRSGDIAAFADAMRRVTKSLAAGAPGIRAALAAKSAAYSCDRAVAGTLEGLRAVCIPRPAPIAQSPTADGPQPTAHSSQPTAFKNP